MGGTILQGVTSAMVVLAGTFTGSCSKVPQKDFDSRVVREQV